MAQPDIVIGQQDTTVVETANVGASRSADPNFQVNPGSNTELRLGENGVSSAEYDARIATDTADLELGGGGGSDSSGSITLHGDGPRTQPHNPLISIGAAETRSDASELRLRHPSGSGFDVVARDADETTVSIEAGRSGRSNVLRLFSGRRLGVPMSGLEHGGQADDPELLFVRSQRPKELRASPILTIGRVGEGVGGQPGELRFLGGPAPQRRLTARIDGGRNTDGAVLSIRDERENENFRVVGQEALVDVGGGSRPGEIAIHDPGSQTTTIRLEGKPSGSPGGRIEMLDTTRKVNVELRGDEGLLALGSSTQNSNSTGTHGKLTLDDGTGDTLAIRAEEGTIVFETDSEGKVLEIETNPQQGDKEIRTKYPIDEGSL